jgi:hypothetical protein
MVFFGVAFRDRVTQRAGEVDARQVTRAVPAEPGA